MAITKKNSSTVTKNGRQRLGTISKEKLTAMLETAKPRLKNKIINRLKLM